MSAFADSFISNTLIHDNDGDWMVHLHKARGKTTLLTAECRPTCIDYECRHLAKNFDNRNSCQSAVLHIVMHII